MAMQAHTEREQKFLVDDEEFSKLNLKNYKQIRQCYLAVEHGDGAEVRFRSSYDTAKLPGQRLDFIQTMKRRRQDDAISRDEVEFAVSSDVFEAAWAMSRWRVEKRRYAIVDTDWTVDVFTSGPLKSVAVAEMEISSEYADVAAYLTATGQQWPSWLARFGGDVVDLTHRQINLVAAGVVAPGPGLLQALDDLKTTQRMRRAQAAYTEQLSKREPYALAPRNRQGVVDLDAAAARARRQGAKA